MKNILKSPVVFIFLTVVLLAGCSSGQVSGMGSGAGSTPSPSAVDVQPTAASGNADAPSITLDQNGQTIQIKVGQRFLLNLGDQYTWDISVADQNILSRVVNIMVIKGAQGVYEAHAVGTTTLTAVGDPTCRQSQPACDTPSLQFEVHINVQ